MAHAASNPTSLSQGAFSGVSFPSTTNGFAVGDQNGVGVVMATTNGGSSWSRQSVPEGTSILNDVSFTSTSTGVAVGHQTFGPSPVDTHAVIIGTTDGGASWTQQTILNEQSELTGVSLLGKDGWAVGAHVNQTTGSIEDLVLRTADGGATWSQQKITPEASALLFDVVMTSATNGYAVGANFAAGTLNFGSPVILHTADGTTWTTQTAPSGALVFFGVDVDPAAPTHAVAAGAKSDGSGGFTQILAKTTDGGATATSWTLETIPAASGALSSGFLSGTTVYAVGGDQSNNATIINGTLGGAYTKQTAPAGTSDLFDVDPHVSTTALFAVGTNGTAADGSSVGVIDATTDAGATWKNQLTKAPAPSPQGYRMDASDGGIFDFGTSAFHGSMGGKPLNKPVVGMTATPDGGGYWLVASDGGIFTFGNAQFFGSMGGKPLNKPVVGMAATPDGLGYWMVASDGGIFTFGDAGFFGSEGGKPLNLPVNGMASTPSGLGYWMVASDGGLFTHGDAQFFGSMGGKPLNKPIVGMASKSDGNGYWEVASDGGIFTFGPKTQFFGSMGGKPLNQPVVGMAARADDGGYWMVASDGGIFAFGGAGTPFLGSEGGKPLNKPIVGMEVDSR